MGEIFYKSINFKIIFYNYFYFYYLSIPVKKGGCSDTLIFIFLDEHLDISIFFNLFIYSSIHLFIYSSILKREICCKYSLKYLDI